MSREAAAARVRLKLRTHFAAEARRAADELAEATAKASERVRQLASDPAAWEQLPLPGVK